jgi:hypothetical protein
MDLCLITPVAHLDCRTLLPGRFCLANIANKHDAYKYAYQEDAKAGYDVVLDNGAFENELVNKLAFIGAIDAINPRVVVAPDILNGDSTENLELAMDFVTTYAATLTGRETMFVPQCTEGDATGYLKSIHTAISSDFHWIGICRNACFNAFGALTHTKDESLNRWYCGIELEREGILERAREKGVRFHMLGIGNDYDLLARCWWVDRADTASLFFQATQGHIIDANAMLPDHVSRPKDYFRRDFNLDMKHEKLTIRQLMLYSCIRAQEFSTKAARLKQEILGGRI